MAEKILKAKHWQLFIAIFAAPMLIIMIAYGIMIGNIVNVLENQSTPDPQVIVGMMTNVFSIMLPITLIMLVINVLWQWSLGITLQNYITEELRRKATFFKITILFPILYFAIILVIMGNVSSLMLDEGSMKNPPNDLPFNPIWFAAIFPFHFFAIFCQFHNFYYAAKTVKIAEFQKPAKLGDFIGELLLLWIYPIGVWIIQPKVNEIAEREPEESFLVTD